MKILIVETASATSFGSMSGYAALLQAAIGDGAVVERLNLSSGGRVLARGPGPIQRRLRLLRIVQKASRILPGVEADVVHLVDGSEAYVARWLHSRVPLVITAHDLIPLLQTKGRFSTHSPGIAARWLIRQSVNGLRTADRIVAVSERTKLDLEIECGIDDRVVRVVPSALQPAFAAAIRECLHTDPQVPDLPELLHIGNNGFYKNRSEVVRVAAKVRETRPVRLVLAGAPPDDSLLASIRALGLMESVRFEPDPSPNRLVALYRSASLLLFPSLYEGFGWPPLEAMAVGCTVVCSNAGSLPEVVGDAALTCDPNATDEMARLCLEVLENTTLARNLRERGISRAKTFSTERMSAQLAEVYEEAIDAHERRRGQAVSPR